MTHTARLLTPGRDGTDRRPVTAGARLAVPVHVAALPDVGEGAVTALVSAYNVEYRIGWFSRHIIRSGAFADSIAAQESIPLFWEHDWSGMALGVPIGHASAEEVDEGLRITGQLYVDDATVARIWRSMQAGALREWSIGYQVLTARYDTDDEDLAEVVKAELLEASSVLRGANPQTRTESVASIRLGDDLGAVAAALRDAGIDTDALAARLTVEDDTAVAKVLAAADVDRDARLVELLGRPETRSLFDPQAGV